MKHAFLITAYTDAAQLKELIQALNSPDSSFFIHLDAKSPLHKTAELDSLRRMANVQFTRKPLRVYWGGFSHFRAIVLLLQEAVSRSGADYFHLLSGQCFPTRSYHEFNAFFERNTGREFITTAPIEQMNWTGGSMNRLQLYHLNDWFNIRVRFWKRINARFLQLQRKLGVKRKLRLPVKQYYGGGTWWSVSRTAALHMVDALARPGILASFRHTHCAEEIVFHTILCNSRLKEKIANDDLRYVDWSTRDGSCPAILDERDLEALRASRKLIARKFVSGHSDMLKACLRQYFPGA